VALYSGQWAPFQLSFAPILLKRLVTPLDRQIYLAVLSSLRQMYPSRQRTLGHQITQRLSRQVPQQRV